MTQIQIQGTGSYLPAAAIPSHVLDANHGFDRGYTEQITGLKQRHYATDERACEMGRKAALKALKAAALGINDLDCIIAACGTMDQAIPCNAALIHQQLAPQKPIPAFDVNMTCLSHIMAMDLAAGLLAQPQYQNILVVSSDIASVGLDWRKPHTAGNFGDGAAALVLSQGSDQTGILASQFETHSEAADYCQIVGAGTHLAPSKVDTGYEDLCVFQMKGKALYRKSAELFPGFVERLLQQAQLSLADIDWVVPHQASALALSHMQKKLGFSDDQFINIYPDHGNQIAASVPTALDYLLQHKPVKRGDVILFLGTSAGLSLGGLILRY